MRSSKLDTGDLAAIGIGGVLGASVRWAVSSLASDEVEGGWFSYAPNTSVTLGTDVDGFRLVDSAQTIAFAGGVPLDTLAVNLAGCLLLGALTLLLVRATTISRRLLIGAATGFCGSLTTFSTLAVELAVLMRARPVMIAQPSGSFVRFERDTPSLAIYLVLSVVGAALAFWVGRAIATRFVPLSGDAAIDGAL